MSSRGGTLLQPPEPLSRAGVLPGSGDAPVLGPAAVPSSRRCCPSGAPRSSSLLLVAAVFPGKSFRLFISREKYHFAMRRVNKRCLFMNSAYYCCII